MSNWLRQSTAVVASFGPAVDKTDGVTLVTSLVSAIDHATTGIKLSKNGGTLTVRHATVTASTYDGYGNYKVTLDTTDTNTLGTLRMQYVDATTVVPIWQDFLVVPAAMWDTYFSTGTWARAQLAADTGLQSLRSNTAQAGASGTITLDASASATDDFYKYTLCVITGGTGIGQSRMISGYTGSSKVAAVTPNWVTTPDATSTFALLPSGVISSSAPPTTTEITNAVWNEARSGHTTAGTFGEGTNVASGGITAASIADNAIDRATFAVDTGLRTIRSNTAQAGATASITLDSGADSGTDFYLYQLVYIVSGTGQGQARVITAYNGTTKAATTSPNWVTTPDNTSVFALLPSGAIVVSDPDIAAIKAKTDNLPEGLKRNQAFNNFEFLMRDAADHVTGKTGLTVTAQRIIDGGAPTACTNSPVEVGGGAYKINFSAADLNGVSIMFLFTAAGADTAAFTVVTSA